MIPVSALQVKRGPCLLVSLPAGLGKCNSKERESISHFEQQDHRPLGIRSNGKCRSIIPPILFNHPTNSILLEKYFENYNEVARPRKKTLGIQGRLDASFVFFKTIPPFRKNKYFMLV
jgi:hypothetical protein